MPVFRFDVTAVVPVTATVEVEADTIEAAHAIVRKPSWYRDRNNVRFTVDYPYSGTIDELLMPGLSEHEVLRTKRP